MSEIRRVIPIYQDVVHSHMTGTTTRLKTSISEEDIATFCNGCDLKQTNIKCSELNDNDQGRAAIRNSCACARVDGNIGTKTKDLFIPLFPKR